MLSNSLLRFDCFKIHILCSLDVVLVNSNFRLKPIISSILIIYSLDIKLFIESQVFYKLKICLESEFVWNKLIKIFWIHRKSLILMKLFEILIFIPKSNQMLWISFISLQMISIEFGLKLGFFPINCVIIRWFVWIGGNIECNEWNWCDWALMAIWWCDLLVTDNSNVPLVAIIEKMRLNW